MVGMWCWLGLRPDSVLTLHLPRFLTQLVFQDGSLQSHGGRVWPLRDVRGHGHLDVLRGGVREVAEVAQQRVLLLWPGDAAQGQVDWDLRWHVSGIFLWCYFSSLMFCFFILNYLFLSSLFTTSICLLYLTQTLPLQYWLFRCNIEIMFPDNIGDHTPKIGDGVITVTLILITRVQCMLSPNIFSNLKTFRESTPTPTPLQLQIHRSDEA